MTQQKAAFITRITGQDDSYLAELLPAIGAEAALNEDFNISAACELSVAQIDVEDGVGDTVAWLRGTL